MRSLQTIKYPNFVVDGISNIVECVLLDEVPALPFYRVQETQSQLA